MFDALSKIVNRQKSASSAHTNRRPGGLNELLRLGARDGVRARREPFNGHSTAFECGSDNDEHVFAARLARRSSVPTIFGAMR
jgi:hypothetical protein